MTRQRSKSFLPIVIIFVVLNGFFISGKNMLTRWGVDQDVVLIGNLFLFFIAIASFLLGLRGLRKPNPHAFVRSVYTSMMLKLFLCIIAAFIYISMYRDNLNKPALFICMGLYLVYTFIEVSILMKLLKGRTHE